MKDEKTDQGTAEREPLAARLRPRTLEEFTGQEHILGPGRLLRRAIQTDQLSSLIFYGPPGTGKTTLARLVAAHTRAHFMTLNAVLGGIADIRAAIEEARKLRREQGRRSILFIDEVHRFNKAQQDALLPHVENGTVILIGATTENPYFEVNKALVSRSRIFELKSLEERHLYHILDRALADSERGYGRFPVLMEPDARAHLVRMAHGDARSLLNALELAVEPGIGANPLRVTLAVAEDSIQQRAVLYDRDGDAHYDTISAFIKSVRGSDPDAALYWLAKMLAAGEEPRFIFRRMLILASEDVGLAAPEVLTGVVAAAKAFEMVGLPEGRFHLSQACLLLALAPKSNSTMAIFDALKAVEKEGHDEVPNHLKDASRDAADFGHGQGYRYPHAYEEHWVAQAYLPDSLRGRVFYRPSQVGAEGKLGDELERRRGAQLAAMLEPGFSAAPGEEGGGSEPAARQWSRRVLEGAAETAERVRDLVLEAAALSREHLVLEFNPGTGLITFEATKACRAGGVWCVPGSPEEAAGLAALAARLGPLDRPVVLSGQPDWGGEIAGREPGIIFDKVLGRHLFDKGQAAGPFFEALLPRLKPGGFLVLFDNLYSRDPRLYRLAATLDSSARAELEEAEEAYYASGGEGRFTLGEAGAIATESAGWHLERREIVALQTRRVFKAREIQGWFSPASALGRFLRSRYDSARAERLGQACAQALDGQPVVWERLALFAVWRRI